MKHGNKKERQSAIVRLIMQEEIPTQFALQGRIATLGFNVTQATLSRDIRELKLTKERRSGKSACYTISTAQQSPETMSSMIEGASVCTDFAGNIAVIHCRVGTAQAIGVSLDAQHRTDVVGTIAGDDTIFVLFRTEEQAQQFALSFVESMRTGVI